MYSRNAGNFDWNEDSSRKRLPRRSNGRSSELSFRAENPFALFLAKMCFVQQHREESDQEDDIDSFYNNRGMEFNKESSFGSRNGNHTPRSSIGTSAWPSPSGAGGIPVQSAAALAMSSFSSNGSSSAAPTSLLKQSFGSSAGSTSYPSISSLDTQSSTIRSSSAPVPSGFMSQHNSYVGGPQSVSTGSFASSLSEALRNVSNQPSLISPRNIIQEKNIVTTESKALDFEETETVPVANEQQYFTNLQQVLPQTIRLDDFLFFFEGRLNQNKFTKENSVVAVITCNEPSVSGVVDDLKRMWRDPRRSSASCVRIVGPAAYTSVSPEAIVKPLLGYNIKKIVFFHLTHVAVGTRGEMGQCCAPGREYVFEACRVLEYVKKAQKADPQELLNPANNPPLNTIELRLLQKKLGPHLNLSNGTEANLAEMAVSTCRASCQQLAKDLPTTMPPDLEFAIVGGVLVHGPWAEYIHTVAFMTGRSQNKGTFQRAPAAAAQSLKTDSAPEPHRGDAAYGDRTFIRYTNTTSESSGGNAFMQSSIMTGSKKGG
mmetsp:Transcript_46138/g.76854  ORF Transcript_46138/g.76854 Transcript_46138/m.76854 type:complete len:544 (+) Transcript_46138:3-1634(+)